MIKDERQNAIDRLSKAKTEDAQMLDLSITEENVNLHVKTLRSFNHNKSADFMRAMFNKCVRQLMTIDDKLNLIALLNAIRPIIETANRNAENDHDNNIGEEYYHYSIILETNEILNRIDKSIEVLRGVNE